MTASFTPGPWETKGLAIFAKGNGYRVADVPPPNRIFRGKEWHEERKYCEGNARLIAAAPDLYEALADLVENKCSEHCDWEAARAVLAAVRGGE